MERLRHRLNLVVLVVPSLWLPLTVIYWVRFLPPLRPFAFHVPAPSLLTIGALLALSAIPAVLPLSYFEPRTFERGALYPALGLRLFRRFAPDGEWINRRLRRLDPTYRIVRNRATRARHIDGSITNERWHAGWFLFGLCTQASALATGQYAWAVALTVFNVVFNLYPVMHQRYKRARLRQSIQTVVSTPVL